MHVRLVDGLRYHHARFVKSDPLVDPLVRVSPQERVQFGVPAGEGRTGPVPSHDGAAEVSLRFDAPRQEVVGGLPSVGVDEKSQTGDSSAPWMKVRLS